MEVVATRLYRTQRQAFGPRAVQSRPPAVRLVPASGVARVARASRRAGLRVQSGAEALRAYLGGLAVVFIMAVILSWSCSTSARLGYRIDELQDQLSSLTRDNERLSFELAGLESMARVEEEATTRLGMVRPKYVRVGSAFAPVASDGRTGGVPAGEAGVRVIALDPGGGPAALSGVASVGAAPVGETVRDSLWQRFFQWLAGVSQAEARDRH